MRTSVSRRLGVLLLPLVAAGLLCCGQGEPHAGKAPPSPHKALGKVSSPEWKRVDQLVTDQKMEAAAEAVGAIRISAQRAGREEEWAQALIKEVQLRIALHGYETSVRFLREEKWPTAPVARLAVQLYYARTLITYLQAYGWEINQREKVESKGSVDLKSWTKQQIFDEAARAYSDVWSHRAELSTAPLGDLGEFLTPNNYPNHIRGTLRDAISYLTVEVLGDSSHWRPEEGSDLFRLDLKALIAGNAAASATVKIDDPAIHPLARVGAILDDLEAWHKAEGHEEAALEARLERIRRLHGAFSDGADRAALRRHLEEILPRHRRIPWWSMAQWQLATLVQQDEHDLVRTHALAVEGEKAYPDSIGGRRCLALYRGIEAPDYQMTAMSSDAPGKRTIEVNHKNVKELYFRAYAVDLVQRAESATDYNLLYNHAELRKLIASGTPAAEWTVALPATPDYLMHRTFVVPPSTLKKLGWHVVAASSRKDFGDSKNRVVAANVIFSDLVLVSRNDGRGGIDVTVLSGDSGKPVQGANVRLYKYDYQRRHTRVDSLPSDAAGAVHLSNSYGSGQSYFLIAQKGDDVTLDASSIYFQHPYEPGEAQSTLLYTDRSVYRPLQKLYWKAVAYRGQARKGQFQVVPEHTLTVTLYDPNNQEVEKKTVRTNAYGTAAGEFMLPTGRVLGGWRIQSSWGNNSAGIRVEEYKRPTFEVTLKEPKETLRLNRPAKLTGEAKYYFGLPVTAGAIKWRVQRAPVYPWWWGYHGWATGGGTQVVATGKAALAADGTFPIEFVPQVDERSGNKAGVTYRYQVNADLTDEGGETRSASRSFRLGTVTVEASLSMEAGFLRAGAAPATISVRRTDLDGTGRAGKGSWRLLAIKQPATTPLPSEVPIPMPPPEDKKPAPFKTPGDAQRERWSPGYSPEATMTAWGDGAEKARGTLDHDAKGEAKLALGSLAPGAYRLRYETTDDFGAKYDTWKDFVVGGKVTPLALPALLLTESSSVKVGGTARFLVHTGLTDQPLYFDTFRDEKLIERRRLGAGQSDLVEIPITEADRGGFGVTVTGLRDHQFMIFSSSIHVPYENKELSVEFSTFRDKIRPGAKETWRVTVKGKAGAQTSAGAAEVLAYMYDRSLDVFAPHSPPSPLSLYPGHTGVAWARANLGAAQVQWTHHEPLVDLPSSPSLHGDALRFYDGYGIGGPGNRNRYYRGGGPGGVPPPMPSARVRNSAPTTTSTGVDRDADGIVDTADKEEEGGFGRGRRAEAPAATTPKPPSEGQAPNANPIRSNFAETAFWRPQLLTGADGSAVIEFTVPDSVTSWNVWVHAVTKDLSSGVLRKETRSVKELLVRPYLPRFFREGDQADLKVVVNNAGDKPLSGTLKFDIIDPETDKSVIGLFGVKETQQAFTVAAGRGTNLTFPVVAPRKVGAYAFKVQATAGGFGDGELRPLPVLPSRLHLAQSRFVTLRDTDKRTMTFADLKKNDDPSLVNEQMVVTVDAQLFYTVLKALPYLVNYPYECTEQTLNRFVSTGIVSTMYRDFPAVAKMAEGFARRDTRLDRFDAADPNRKMTLEESPWLQQAQGKDGSEGMDLVNVLDPKIAKASRDEALAKLRKMQTSSGAFPWFPGGPPSPYMTLYLMHGFAKATEFGVDVPKDVVVKGWGYLARHFRDEYARRMVKEDYGWEFLTLLNYVASSYPDASWTGDALTLKERKEILAYCFKHWKQHSPYLKGLLALTLKRMERPADGKLVWESVMDSAKTAPDQGTFWTAEDRSWLWYNDTIESHAFALRVLMELDPKNAKKDGLVLWLLLNKKMNQWKSTRATAEVIYSLIHYMKKEGTLGIREEAIVSVGTRRQTFEFQPDKYVGKTQVVVPGADVDPATTSTVTVEKSTKGILFASATWHFSTEKLPTEERGDFFSVSRKYFLRQNNGKEWVLKPLAEGQALAPGDEVEVQISLRSKHAAEYVHLRDPRAAGLEPENAISRYKWNLGIGWYEETRDSGSNFFFEQLPQGEYTFKYRLRANLGGTFRVGPAMVQSMYAPEFTAYSAGNVIKIAPAP